MGLANVLKPSTPWSLSLSLMSDEELSHQTLTDNTIGTNPETVLITIENKHTDNKHREALKQISGHYETAPTSK